MTMKNRSQKAIVYNASPWVLFQKWEQLLFIHWPVSSAVLAEQLPKGIELDTFEGQAWISIVSLQVSKNRLRYLPRIPYIRPMLQLNVRTYVKRKEKRGVYFFTMDTNKLAVVLGAKIIHAPFLYAKMTMEKLTNTYHIYSSRKGEQHAAFRVSYLPEEETFYPEKSSLDEWLLERYIFWTYKKGHLYRGDVEHTPWEVQNANVNIEDKSVLFFLLQENIEENPVTHYARCKVTYNGMIRKESF